LLLSQEESLWRDLALGLLAGVAALTNTTLLAVFPFCWLCRWVWNRRRQPSCTKWLAASVTLCVLVVLPWTVRNYEVFHRLIPIRDNFGLELWLGNHEGVNHVFDQDFPILNPTEYNHLGEIHFMEVKQSVALEFIGRHPGDFLKLTAERFLRFWSAPEKSGWLVISLFAWVGMVLSVRRKGMEAVPYAGGLILFPIVYYLTHVFSTYRHPIEPVILLLASYTAVSITEIVGPRLVHRTSSDSRVQ